MVETPFLKEASPLYLEGQNGKAVLVIHGYTGYPGEFYETARALNDEGYTVSLPRLPGHGTSRDDFYTTGWKDWLGHVEKAYRELEENFDSPSLVGLSMGGVLALILASRFSPERTALLAPAMAVRNKIFYATPLLKFFVKKWPKEWTPEEGDSDDVRTLGREYWSSHMPGQMAQLYKLMRLAKRGLKNVNSPTLIMLSRIDGSVPLYAGTIIEKGLRDCPVKKVILEESPHVLVAGKEKKRVIAEVIRWINQEEISEK